MEDGESLENCLSILTVFHNHVSFVDPYFKSFQNVFGSLPCKLIIIDNESNDGTQKRLELWKEKSGFDFEYHPLDVNHGFGAVHNRFVASADTRNLLFLNPDVSFIYDFLSPCVHSLDRYEGLISPMCRDLSGKPYISYSPFYESEWFLAKKFLYTLYPLSEPQDVDWVQGSCLFLKKEQFLAAGGFRKEYFVFTEDMALARDFKELGWGSKILKNQWVFHPNRELTTAKFQRMCSNLVHYFEGRDPKPYARYLKFKAVSGQIPLDWVQLFEKSVGLTG